VTLCWRSSVASKVFASFHPLAKLWRPVFGVSEAVVLCDYLEQGNTITGAYYANLIVRKETRKVEPRRRGVLFHQHYAPAHMSPQALAAIRNSGLELLANPPSSLDLASDFYLFPKPKEFLRGRKFADGEEVTYKWLARRARTILQLNPCFGELLDQVHISCSLQESMLKNDKWCTYVVVNCVRLRTF